MIARTIVLAVMVGVGGARSLPPTPPPPRDSLNDAIDALNGTRLVEGKREQRAGIFARKIDSSAATKRRRV